jgi:hypothetical protein
MPDPGKMVAASVRYEIRLISGPRAFDFRSEGIRLDAGQDLAVLIRTTMMGTRIVDEVIVGIIGSEYRSEAGEFLALRDFLASGGIIGLNRELL